MERASSKLNRSNFLRTEGSLNEGRSWVESNQPDCIVSWESFLQQLLRITSYNSANDECFVVWKPDDLYQAGKIPYLMTRETARVR